MSWGHQGNQLQQCFTDAVFVAATIKSAAYNLFYAHSHRHTDVSPREIRLRGIHQQVCVVVMAMRWGERLRERGGRGGLRIR